MQLRIDHLLAELALRHLQKYGKKSEKASCGKLIFESSID